VSQGSPFSGLAAAFKGRLAGFNLAFVRGLDCHLFPFFFSPLGPLSFPGALSSYRVGLTVPIERTPEPEARSEDFANLSLFQSFLHFLLVLFADPIPEFGVFLLCGDNFFDRLLPRIGTVAEFSSCPIFCPVRPTFLRPPTFWGCAPRWRCHRNPGAFCSPVFFLV